MAHSFEEKIANLLILSKVDLRIVDMNQKKNKLPIRLKEINYKLTSGRSSFQSMLDEIAQSEEKKKKLEEENKDLTEKVSKAKSKLYDIKTNDAYKAALKEIDNFEHERKIREDEILKIMETLDKLRPKTEELMANFKPEEEVLLKEEQIIFSELKIYEKEIADLMKEREECAKKVDERIVKEYDRIRKSKGGIALVEVSTANCTGCNMGIRPQLFNDLMKRNDLLRCPNCGRMIYYNPPKKD